MLQLELGTIIHRVTVRSGADCKIVCNTIGTVVNKLDSTSYNIGGCKVHNNRIYVDTLVPAMVECPVQLPFSVFIYCTEDKIPAAIRYVKETYNLTIVDRQKELAKLLLDCNVLL